MGTDRHENYTISLGFSRANRGAPDTARDAVLLREQRPYLRTSRFQGHELLQRKDNSSPGPPSTSPSSVALPHLVPKDLSPCPGWGILTHSLSVGSETNTSMCLRFGRRLASERISPIP
ncbi:hypothetical protein JTE90_012552 [Oedothorax gibbosus]|uniref:Uncharacterized protein n=1 Tax=Oedothorax gibbosus TaxID=931172 RepID=A0AAV6TKC1_9ARAC|nr:hypothetical protein JTE90_006691 [Oedothorax gibbosus]KAG8172392.1 hypothetical protein JTE90_012552 [Oedothorax gibbosus]